MVEKTSSATSGAIPLPPTTSTAPELPVTPPSSAETHFNESNHRIEVRGVVSEIPETSVEITQRRSSLRRLYRSIRMHKFRSAIATVLVVGVLPALGTAMITSNSLSQFASAAFSALNDWQYRARLFIAGITPAPTETASAPENFQTFKAYRKVRQSLSPSDRSAFSAEAAGLAVTWIGFVTAETINGDGRLWLGFEPPKKGLDGIAFYGPYDFFVCFLAIEEREPALALLGSNFSSSKVEVSGIIGVSLNDNPATLQKCHVNKVLATVDF